MHHIYHTEAILLKSTLHGEANKRVWLFTKELGLIVASVQGVRKSGAKLIGHTIDYSVLEVDLIRGREVWRLISSKNIDIPISGKERLPLTRAYVRTLSAIERFVVGEEQDDFLFNHIKDCVLVLKQNIFEAKYFDTLSLWFVFTHLGYINPKQEDKEVFGLSIFDAYKSMDEQRHKRFLLDVKKAIEQSHL